MMNDAESPINYRRFRLAFFTYIAEQTFMVSNQHKDFIVTFSMFHEAIDM